VRRLGVASGGETDSMTLLSPGIRKSGNHEQAGRWRLATALPTC
jgi:hypothetical protein